MAFDTTILKVQLDEGISHLTYYKNSGQLCCGGVGSDGVRCHSESF